MRKKEVETELPFKTESFARAWDEWLEYRRERRLPKYVPTGLKRTYTGLIRDSNNDEATAIAIINNAIEKNWQGLFPLKNQSNGQNIKPSAAERRSDKFRDFVAKGQAAYQELVTGRKQNPGPEV